MENRIAGRLEYESYQFAHPHRERTSDTSVSLVRSGARSGLRVATVACLNVSVTVSDVYLLPIHKPADLAQLLEAVQDSVQTQWFSPTLADNGALIIKSDGFGKLVIPSKSARQMLISKIRKRLERVGYLEEEGWTPDQIQDLEDVWERHKDD
jgi:hypothetical protein